ncbi:ABC transporter substrate-binding protein [Lichenibacterium ramalinae]|uniref:ABC transporter substrate-binding protein n=1 Tax=Lichenibacterium ramalinae TaxID=2316527 RepID=A0A4Q2RHJ9_9HYPH|nr:ABC transporter substrate-binding protein [Lichenibacterium ramalinae]RYB07194.1 ABC transporter substrate-binding protein [Lichenibacterium ramalinae]
MPPIRLPAAARVLSALLAASLLASTALPARAAEKVHLSFFYPVAIGGPVTRIVDDLVADFETANPDVDVKAVYAGTYQETIGKALTARKGGQSPDVAVLLSADMFTMIDQDAVLPVDGFAKDEAAKAWLGGFFPAFMRNSRTADHVWGIPFQRSTTVLYWNKDAFKEAGLDPEKAPQSWDELVADGKKLTKADAAGQTTQWGVQIPSNLTAYWLLQGLAAQAGALLTGDGSGTTVTFDAPGVVSAMQFWVDLAQKHHVMKPGSIDWATTPKDFFERKAAIMYTTTGNLTNVRKNAPFPFGVAMLPADKQRGTPTGGGNLYVFKTGDAAREAAAFKLVRFLSSPERAAEWGIKTGYVATRPDAWETPAMKSYVQEFPPAAVARDQLQYAVAELSTYDNQRVARTMDDAIQAVLTGAKTPAAALQGAQAEADRLLKPYR